MIHVKKYWVINGEKSDPFFIDKQLEDEAALERFRKQLEVDNECSRTSITGERIKIASIAFEFQNII